MTEVKAEKMEFQTEVKDLLNLMINSLYSHKEIFLRELISNAADAIDKIRFESIANGALLGEDKLFRIAIQADSQQKVLRISDNGIGMNRQDLIDNLGTIARSGTRNFVKSLSGEQKTDMNLIGQFGVGFYSVFMVASKVEVISRKAGESQAWLWTSEGTGEFELSETEKLSRGTDLLIYIKDDEDAQEFLQDWSLRSTILKYSEYITHPIYLITKESPSDTDQSQEAKTKEEHLNDKPAIWRRSKEEVEESQYQEFYKHVSMGSDTPLAWSHNHVEGTQEYHSLIFIPNKAPFGIFQNDKHHGLKLYVKRVFIMEDCKELLPNWLRFVKGVIDSEDLPLNVSREILQSNKIISGMRKHVTKKVLDLLKSKAETEPTVYHEWFREMGNILKEGFYMNWEHLDELKALLRFQSSNGSSEKDLTSLADYVSRMREDQKDIYYITGENRNAVQNSPHLEVFKDKGYEVLYMVDTVDEWVFQSLSEFDGKKFKNITKGDVELQKSEEEIKEEKSKQGTFKKLCKSIEKELEADIKEVRVSSRLKDSPACLVSDEHGMSANMERIMQMANQEYTKSKRILEINPDHNICKFMLNAAESKSDDLSDWIKVLYNQALLAEGSPIENPGEYVRKVNTLLAKTL
jgi:molecular chaperone HtpG